jgi:hypothetical protein
MSNYDPFAIDLQKYNFDEYDTYHLVSYADVSEILAKQLSKYENFIFCETFDRSKSRRNILFDCMVPQTIKFAENYASILCEWLKELTGTCLYDYQITSLRNPILFPDVLVDITAASTPSVLDPAQTRQVVGTEILSSALIIDCKVKNEYFLTIPASIKPCILSISYYSRNPLEDVADIIYDLDFIRIEVDNKFQSVTIKLTNPLMFSVVVSCSDADVQTSIELQLGETILFRYASRNLQRIKDDINSAFKRLYIYIKYIKYKIYIKNNIYIKEITEFIYETKINKWEYTCFISAKNNFWGYQSIQSDINPNQHIYLQKGTSDPYRLLGKNGGILTPALTGSAAPDVYPKYQSVITSQGFQSNLQFYSTTSSLYSNQLIKINTISEDSINYNFLFNNIEYSLKNETRINGYLKGVWGMPIVERKAYGTNTIYQSRAGYYRYYCAYLFKTTLKSLTEISQNSVELVGDVFSEDFTYSDGSTFVPSIIGSFKDKPKLSDGSIDYSFIGTITYEYNDSQYTFDSSFSSPSRNSVISWINQNYWLKKDYTDSSQFLYPKSPYQITSVLNSKLVYTRWVEDTPLEIKDVPDSIRTKEIHAALAAGKFSTDDTGNERVANLGYLLERIARVLGISVNADGSVRSVRQRAKLDDGSTIPAGWNFGQFGLNSGNSSEGQKGGKSDERRDGIAYQQISNQLLPDKFDPEKSEISGGNVVLCENWPQLIQTILEDLDLALNLQESAAGAIPAGDGSGRVMLYQGLGELVAELAYGQSRISGHTSRTLISSQVTQATTAEVLKGLGLPLAVKTFEQRLGEGESDLAQVPFPALEAGAPTITAQMGWLLQNLGLLLANSVVYSEENDDKRK